MSPERASRSGSPPAIVVEGLSKRYRIGLEDARPDTLAGAARNWITAPLTNYRRLRGLSRFDGEDGRDVIWALRDVSFEVGEGEVVGIIGKNGAGKSTLLKILSRITYPTAGRARLRGRASSLLEVGTGFHPELTGRENIYLNGTILGMSRAEVDSKLDQIVDFSGVERFIDTPVKRYSSGMKVRLAFSVAAHLEPEILLVDEVLAVGDAEFRKRSLGKMEDVAGEGRTVVFVSHNMAMMSSLCERGILLREGRIVRDDSMELVIQEYLAETRAEEKLETSLAERTDRKGGEAFRFESIEFLDPRTLRPLGTILSGEDVLIEIRGRAERDFDSGVTMALGLYKRDGSFVSACESDVVEREIRLNRGENVSYCLVRDLPLSGGRYFVDVNAKHDGRLLDWIKNAAAIDVEHGDFYGTGRVPAPHTQGVFLDFDWPEEPGAV